MIGRVAIVAIIATAAACAYDGRPMSGDPDATSTRDGPAGASDATDAPPGTADAPPGTPDAQAYPCDELLCDPGSCDGDGWCVLDECDGCTRVCPPAHYCRIDCGDGDCGDGITLACAPTSTCAIVCGDNACQANAPRCEGGARCDIYCYGNNACQSGTIACTAEICDISCDPQGGSSNCDGTVDCDDPTVQSCTVHCCGDDCGTVECGGCTPDMVCDPPPG